MKTGESLKIATMVRAYLPAPRPADIVYAPIDLAMAICEGLAERGHHVTYYGPKGSKPPVHLKTLDLEPLARNNAEFQQLVQSTDMQMHYIPGLWDYYYVRDMFERARKGEFDLLHFHHVESALPFVSLYPEVPVVYTVHDPIFPWYQQVFDMYHSDNQHYVSISNSQRLPAPSLPYVATIYNGIHVKDYDFSAEMGDYLLFAGRIVPEKGVLEAIKVAERTKQKLLIIGPVFETGRAYFNKSIKPRLNKNIRYLGYMEREKLAEYMRHAKAFLMPIKWEEPFGMTMIESLATGTPVIAMRRGSVPEVLIDGVTGYIVNDLSGMVRAVGKIDKISREVCRDYIVKNFSISNMVHGYENAFELVLKKMRQTKA